MKRLLLVALCGGFGSGARYLLGGWIAQSLGSVFPFGTIAINAIGSFLIAVIMYLSLTANVIGPDLRLALATGVMGGFHDLLDSSTTNRRGCVLRAWGLAAGRDEHRRHGAGALAWCGRRLGARGGAVGGRFIERGDADANHRW